MLVWLVVAAVVVLLVVVLIGYDRWTTSRQTKWLSQDGYAPGDPSVPGTDAAVNRGQVEGQTHGMGNGYAG